MRKPALHVIALLVALALTASLAQSSAAGSIFYFRDSTPSEPMPNGTTTSDSFSGGLWLGRSMAGDPGASAETETVALSSTGDPAYWRMVSFVSDPLVSHVLPAGTWTLGISAMESSPSANAYLRATIFLWSTNDTKGAEIVPIQTSSTEFQTSWGDIVWALSGSETVVAQGDKLGACGRNQGSHSRNIRCAQMEHRSQLHRNDGHSRTLHRSLPRSRPRRACGTKAQTALSLYRPGWTIERRSVHQRPTEPAPRRAGSSERQAFDDSQLRRAIGHTPTGGSRSGLLAQMHRKTKGGSAAPPTRRRTLPDTGPLRCLLRPRWRRAALAHLDRAGRPGGGEAPLPPRRR
jgi:hypothetical protein